MAERRGNYEYRDDGTSAQLVTGDMQLTGSYKGYSNESKPVINNPVDGILYTFLELDTKNIYVLHNGQWVLFL